MGCRIGERGLWQLSDKTGPEKRKVHTYTIFAPLGNADASRDIGLLHMSPRFKAGKISQRQECVQESDADDMTKLSADGRSSGLVSH